MKLTKKEVEGLRESYHHTDPIYPDMLALIADWLEQDAELAALRKVVEAVRVWYESDPRTLTVKQLYAIGDALDAYDALKGGQR